jgi:hypothetical protein
MKLSLFGAPAPFALLGMAVLTGCARGPAVPPASPPPAVVGVTRTTSAPAAQREVNLAVCTTSWDDLETKLTFDCPR